MKKGFLHSILFFFFLSLSYRVSAQPLPTESQSLPFIDCFMTSYNYPCGDLYAKQIFSFHPSNCEPLTEVAYCASYDFFVQDPTQKATSPRQAAVNYQWYYNTTKVGDNNHYYTSPVLKEGDSVWVVMSGRCNLMKKVYAKKYNDNQTYTASIRTDLVRYCVSSNLDMGKVIREVYFDNRNLNRDPLRQESETNWHYAWKINDATVGTDAPTYTTPLIKYNDQLTVTVTGPRICPTTFKYDIMRPGFNATPVAKTAQEMLAMQSFVPNIKPPLSLQWMVDGRASTNATLGELMSNGNERYTDLRFGATANLAHGTQIWLEIRGVEQCAPPGTTKIQSSNTYTFTRPGDGFNDITAISIKRFKTPTDSLITNGVINLADTTVRFDININDGYGNAPVVDKISMNTKVLYYPTWTKATYPTSTDLLRTMPILQTHIATNGQVKIWKITINLNSGPTPGTTPSAPPGTGSGN